MPHPEHNRAIGIFDSGVGGLTVFSAIQKLLPGESLIYLGDTARVPYGTKSPETVIRYALEDAAFLVEQNVKAIVVACNTVSSCALPALAARFELPIIGVIEPGVEAALAVTTTKRIGVIGTSATIESGAYERLFRARQKEIHIVRQACPLFVPLVEEGWFDDAIAVSVAERYLKDLQREEIDTLVLGCTHYPLLAPVLEKVLGRGVALVDSASAVAHALRSLLAGRELLASDAKVSHRICVTDVPLCFEKIAAALLKNPHIPLSKVTLK